MYDEIHGEGSPLVLLHGSTGTIDSCFAGLLPALATARQVIAMELQGHGHTADIPRPLSYQLATVQNPGVPGRARTPAAVEAIRER